jgi:hypothetical protein
MIIEQTVEILADRRLVIEVPQEIPVGKTILCFIPAAVENSPRTVAEALWLAAKKAIDPNRKPLSRHFGIHKGIFGDVDGVTYQRGLRDEWD